MIYIHTYIYRYIYISMGSTQRKRRGGRTIREMRLMRLTRQPFNLSSKAFSRSAALPLCSVRLSLSLPLLLFCLRCPSVCLSVYKRL